VRPLLRMTQLCPRPRPCVLVYGGVFLALALVAVGASGCSSSAGTAASSPAQRISVASGQLKGDHTETLDLGTQALKGDVWVAWVLKGKWNSRAIFSLRLETEAGGAYTSTIGPLSYGGQASITNDRGMTISNVVSATYHVYLTEKVRPSWPQGYAADLEVFTSGQ
jgi:hypothetical protein